MDKRFNFLGVSISVINQDMAAHKIGSYSFLSSHYICFPDTSVVNAASKDLLLTYILNNALLTMPDGKPSQIAARLQGFREAGTVSGYHLCNTLLNSPLTHYFYGGDKEVLASISAKLRISHPKAKILGYKAPPFVDLKEIKHNETIRRDIQEINALKPDLVWIGISSPKQDYLMHYFRQYLDRSLMLGIGGVFLYLSDESLKSPEILKKMGLRWAYRLLKEPARLWPKYYGTIRFLLRNYTYFFTSFYRRRVFSRES